MASSRKLPKNSSVLARVTAAVKRHVHRGDSLVAGLSGGIDSIVLLDLLHRASRRAGFELAAIHVNHRINPAAGKWASFCRAFCRARGIPLLVKAVEVKRGNSLEAAARAARYAVFSAVKCNVIALAHNQDDQAETLLLQLLRGTGVKGASAMPEYRAEDSRSRIERSAINARSRRRPVAGMPAVLRPLLDVPRSEILEYAKSRKLSWIEDDSNTNIAFDRNYLRHRVLPIIAERYPAYRRTLARASRHFAEAADLLDACAARDAGEGDALDLARLRGLSVARGKNVLRHFLARCGVLMPNTRKIEELARQLMRVGVGASIRLTTGAHDLRCHGGKLHVVASMTAVSAPAAVQWHGEKRLPLTAFGGTLMMKPARGKGISLQKISGKNVSVRARAGGERLRLAANRPSRTLKNLWQEAGTPLWLRENAPLLFANDELVYVAGLGVDAAFCAVAGEVSVLPDWLPQSA